MYKIVIMLNVSNAVTVPEYAAMRGCSTKNVYNQIYAGRALPGVSRYSRSGKTYLLFIDVTAVKDKALKAATRKRIKNNSK